MILFDLLPPELIREIFVRVDLSQIVELHPIFNYSSLLEQNIFWKKKMLYDFGIDSIDDGLEYKTTYLKIFIIKYALCSIIFILMKENEDSLRRSRIKERKEREDYNMREKKFWRRY